MLYVAFIKIFFSRIRANWWALESFPPPVPKNVLFPLSRHDRRRVHEIFFLADSSELICVRVISASWYQKRLIPIFWTWCTSSSWKIFFSPIRLNWWVLVISATSAQKRLFPLCRHDVRRVYKKFFLVDSSELMGVRVISASWAQKRLIPNF